MTYNSNGVGSRMTEKTGIRRFNRNSQHERTGANNTMGMYRKCSYSRIVSVCCAESMSVNVERNLLKTYDAKRINDDGIDMRTCRLVCNLERIMDDMWPKSQLLYSIHHSRAVVDRVNK